MFLSQKIRSAEEKKRLKGIAAAVLPKNFGVIIRTAAVEAKDSDIEQDIRSLLDKWQKTLQNIRKNPAPAQLMSEMNRANTIIRDSLGGAFRRSSWTTKRCTMRFRTTSVRSNRKARNS